MTRHQSHGTVPDLVCYRTLEHFLLLVALTHSERKWTNLAGDCSHSSAGTRSMAFGPQQRPISGISSAGTSGLRFF